MIYYETDRLVLRNYQHKDVSDYFEYMSLESTALHEDFYPYSLDKCEEAVNARLQDDFYWVVELKENKKMIGDISFSSEEYESFEIAYDFNELFGKMGYATEACSVLIKHIFTVLNGRRVYAGCNVGNTASWRLLERLGFRREAHCLEDVSFKHDENGKPIYCKQLLLCLVKERVGMHTTSIIGSYTMICMLF